VYNLFSKDKTRYTAIVMRIIIKINISKVDSSDVKSTEIASSALHRDQTQHRFRKNRSHRKLSDVPLQK
jgi:hypothetical protein